MPIQKKTIQKKKTSKSINTKLVEDFKYTYANAIVSICRHLTHNDDSSIDYHRLRGRGYLSSFGSISLIYQAGKPNWDNEIDNAHIIFSIDKKETINNNTIKAIENAIEEVNELLIEDMTEMLEKTYGGWYRRINKNNVSSILDLNSEIHMSTENKWSLSFTPIDDVHGPLRNGWVPQRVKEIYDEMTDNDYHHNRNIWDNYGYETEEESEEDE